MEKAGLARLQNAHAHQQWEQDLLTMLTTRPWMRTGMALHFDRGGQADQIGKVLFLRNGDRKKDILVTGNMYLQIECLISVAEIRKNAPWLSCETEKPAIQHFYEH